MLRISPFGLIEMTRQRIRPSLRRSIYEDCPCCHGTGLVKTAESMAIEVMRLLLSSAHREQVSRDHGRSPRSGGDVPEQPQTSRPDSI